MRLPAIELVFTPESAEEEPPVIAACGSPDVCLLVRLCPAADESQVGPAAVWELFSDAIGRNGYLHQENIKAFLKFILKTDRKQNKTYRGRKTSRVRMMLVKIGKLYPHKTPQKVYITADYM